MTATAEVLQMPANESASNREAEEQLIRSRKEEAEQHYAHIQRAAVLQNRNSLRIGFHAYALKKANLWGLLGFRDEDEAREAAGVKSSSWYNVIRLAESFDGLPEELFIGMKLANCDQLANLSENRRLDREWVGWASSESMKVFAERVDAEMNGKARDSDTKERITTMKMSMPASRRTVIEEGAKKFAEKHGMDTGDVSRAIEVMVVEQTEGSTLIGAITGAVQRIKAAKEQAHSGISVDEALAFMEKTMDEMVLDFAAALEGAKREEAA